MKKSLLSLTQGKLLARKAVYNLRSQNKIAEPCSLDDLEGWFQRELKLVRSVDERAVLSHVARQLDSFVCWPERAILLWASCHRVPEAGKHNKYFKFPPTILELLKEGGFPVDARANGPAIAAYQIAGGKRPKRYGSLNAWSIHHLYSGKFPYIGRESTIHAAKDPLHFSQSAGLIAAHPVADAMADEFPFFAWYLRAKAYLRFQYDPDGVFSGATNRCGFARGCGRCKVIVP